MIKKNLHRLLLPIFVLMFMLIGKSWAQTTTTVFTDNFNRGSAVSPMSAGGTPSVTYSTFASSSTAAGQPADASTSRALLTTGSGSDYGLQVIGASLGVTGTSYRTWVSAPLSGYAAPFTNVLSSNSGDISWTFHTRTNRGSFPISGLGAGQYGGGVVLAGTNSVLDSLGDGYAVIFEKGINAVGNAITGNANIVLTSPSASAIGIVVGMTVTGTGIPASTTVTSISGNTITLSANPTSSSTTRALTFSWIINGTFASGSTSVTLSSALPSYIYVGQQVVSSGSAAASDIKITAISSDRLTVTLSAATTAAGTNAPVTFGNGSNLKLVKYTGGLVKGTRTNLVVPSTEQFSYLNNCYWVGVKVVYTPSTNTWQYSTRIDAIGASGTSTSSAPSADFTSPALTSWGSVVDNSYTGSTMSSFGLVWNHSAAASTYTSSTVFLDNYSVNVNSTNPTLSSPTVSSITSTSALLGATVAAGTPSAITSRGTVYKTASGVTYADNLLAEGGTTTGAFNHSRTGLSPETQYYFKGFATNVASSSSFAGLSTESSFRTLSSPPSSQATSLSGTGVSNVQVDLSWTAATFPGTGATAKGYVLLMAESPNTPSFVGVNGEVPSAGANTSIVSAAVSSSATTYSVTGLNTSTTYNFLLVPFTYDGTNSTTYSYLTASAPTASGTTTAGAAPALSAPTVASITSSSATLGATIDSDGGATITERGTVFSTVSPATISNNLLAEGGTATGAFSHSRTGLSPQTLYYYKGYAINSGATGLSTEGSFRTLSNAPTSEASSFSASAVAGDQINLSWSSATFPSTGATSKGYVIVRAVYPNTPSISNSNGQSAVAGTNSTIISSSIAGTATSASSTGLSGFTRYNYVIIPFTWDGVNASTYNYYTSNAPSADATTLASVPSAQPTNLSFSSVTCNGMTVNWTAASGAPDGYLVLQTSGASAPNTNPVSGTTYSAGSSLGNATVAYVGSGSSFTLSSLSDNTSYNFKAYSFNGSGSNISYLTTSPLSATQASSVVSAPSATSASSVYSNEFTANWDAVTPCVNSYVLDVATTNNFTANGIIASEGFENSLTLFSPSTVGTGTYVTGTTSATADRPVSSPYKTQGNYGFAEVNGTVGIATSNINTLNYSNVSMSFKLSALSISSTLGGPDASDSVTVSVSPDGGTTWYQTLKITGNGTNSVWSFTETGVATTAYDGNATPVVFAGGVNNAANASNLTDGNGLSTITITGLPSTSNLRVNISMRSSNSNEYWVIDDFKVTGDAPSFQFYRVIMDWLFQELLSK